MQLGDSGLGSTEREPVNKRNENDNLAGKQYTNSPEKQARYFDGQTSFGSALVTRTHQVNPGNHDIQAKKMMVSNLGRPQQQQASTKSGINTIYSNVNSQSQALHHQAAKQHMQSQQ